MNAAVTTSRSMMDQMTRQIPLESTAAVQNPNQSHHPKILFTYDSRVIIPWVIVDFKRFTMLPLVSTSNDDLIIMKGLGLFSENYLLSDESLIVVAK